MLSTKQKLVYCILVELDNDGQLNVDVHEGIKLSSDYVVYIDCEGIVMERYINITDDLVMFDPRSRDYVYLHAFNVGYPPDSISLEKLGELSAVEFMAYLTTLYRRDERYD